MSAMTLAQAASLSFADGEQAYAMLPLYADDFSRYSNGDTVTLDSLNEYASSYSNVEVVKVSDSLRAYNYEYWDGNVFPIWGASGTVKILSTADSNTAPQSVLYKITSTLPDGFDELDISFISRSIENCNGFYSIVYGGDTVETANNHLFEYSTPNGENTAIARAPYDPTPYSLFGDTLKLTDQVKGKKEYYISFNIYSQMSGWSMFGDISFSEKVPVDYTDTDKYSSAVMRDMGGFDRFGGSEITAGNHSALDSSPAVNFNCEAVNVFGRVAFSGDRDKVNPVKMEASTKYYDQSSWIMGSVTYKLTAPEGQIFKGLEVDLDGQCTIEESAGKSMSTAVTTFAGDSIDSVSVVNRSRSYTDADGNVVNSVGELEPFVVAGNNKEEMYIKIMINNGELDWTYLRNFKFTGIFADNMLIDDIAFSGSGVFPTNGVLDTIFKIGKQDVMPDSLLFIVAVYDNTTNKLIDFKAETNDSIVENTTYKIQLNNLPTDGNCYGKAFVWSDLESQVPISRVFEVGKE